MMGDEMVGPINLEVVDLLCFVGSMVPLQWVVVINAMDHMLKCHVTQACIILEFYLDKKHKMQSYNRAHLVRCKGWTWG